MFDSIFDKVVDELTGEVFNQNAAFWICLSLAVLCGAVIMLFYWLTCRIKKERFTKSVLITIMLMPIAVMLIVFSVNGPGGANAALGTGIAIAGAFALIRFRSVPAAAKDVVIIFFAMGTGVALGAGFLWMALALTGVVCVLYLVLNLIPFDGKNSKVERELKITMPEDLDYATEFAPIFSEFTSSAEMVSIKTTKMGSLFVVVYRVKLKAQNSEKALIDALRVKNSNLPINCKTGGFVQTEQEF